MRRVSDDEAGYVAIDALVALMILTSTLICSLAATHGSRRSADAALELRKANELAAYLLETAPTTPGETSGEADGLSWTVTVFEPEEAYGPSAICDRRVVLVGQRAPRRYEARANAVCPKALES